MTLKQIDNIIKQITHHKLKAIRNNIDTPYLDDKLIGAYRLRDKIERAENRDIVIDKILELK